MRYVIISLAFFLSGCALNPANQKASTLQYDRVLSFGIGVSNERDVVETLGMPTSRIVKNGYYTLTYDDPATGFQRLSVNFISASRKLSGFLWIPRQDEKEFTLGTAKAGFKNADFKEVRDVGNNPHFVSEVVSFVDEKSGITIRYDRRSHKVEAIARYDVSNRVPASENK